MKIDLRTLGNPIAEGGEGILYKYDKQIIKIFKNQAELPSKLAKLEILLNTKNLPKNSTSPKDLVYGMSGNFVGYIMNDLGSFIEFRELCNKKTLQVYNLKISHISKMLVDTQATLTSLHESNIFVGDLNDSNIVFTSDFKTSLIDTDSWSIGKCPCTVAMDEFKDPELSGCNFSETTDAYAFAVLVFKVLTRLHPFGGTTSPDMDLLTRMRKGLSVLNPKVKVTIPRIIESWKFLSPALEKELEAIYDNGIRNLITDTLNDFSRKLTMCKNHNNEYYARFDKCPVCHDAKIKPTTPTAVPVKGVFPVTLLFEKSGIQLLSEFEYFLDNRIYCLTGNSVPVIFGQRNYFYGDGTYIEVMPDAIHAGGKISKLHNSPIIVDHVENTIVYVTPGLGLNLLEYLPQGNAVQELAKISINSIFDYQDGLTFVCNFTDNKTIIQNHLIFIERPPMRKPKNYGTHLDSATKHWLFIYEENGKFNTLVFDNNSIIFESDSLKYTCDLNAIAFYNNTIYTAHDKFIRGFNFKTNTYKDFPCNVVEDGAKLVFHGKQIQVINDTSIYKLG
jgi:serine/threonine protein kinase